MRVLMIDYPQELKFPENNLFMLNVQWHLPLRKIKENLCHHALSVVSTIVIIIILLSLGRAH